MSDIEDLLSKLRGLDPYEFEQLVAELWEERGWQTAVSEPGADQGIDVMASKQFPYEEKIAIQAKRYGSNSRVSGPDIQQYAALKQNSGVDQVVVVTTGKFTGAAQDRAEELNVKCIDGKRLTAFIGDLNAEDIVNKYVEVASLGETSSSTNPSISTPKIKVEIIGLLKGSEIADYSTFPRTDLEDEFRGGGFSEREAVILEVTSVNSKVQFNTHEVTFGSKKGYEYEGSNPAFVGYFEQSLENQFSKFNDSISPKQSKTFICVTEPIPDGVDITSVNYDGEFSFSLEFGEQSERLHNSDPREVL
ncbi:restriction endonuclease [Haloterrigena salifodinae]|uniref:Restriction endonuclease n=1 Tax=Haloterrigena salifodinae TaxID=2675099 RepID=A0A8T8DYJ9_9EURY|nr:restriction endonuclease [Haloterrigena salifodinae]QRV14654.1 restriction endonuclease [Haloterrigena salifodinae]